MGRPKNFSREDVLEKAIPLFWKKGFADTSVQDLEQATGVNKSGLYSEFSSKDEIFLESLRHYLIKRDGSVLKQAPLGWENIKNFLSQSCPPGTAGGCLMINSMRELTIIPTEAQGMVTGSMTALKILIAQNIAAATPEADAGTLAEVTLTFFAGLCLEQNLGKKRAASTRKIESFLALMQK
jgi:AcrR family transcriptional regulator